ncbi:hypothetical protein M422DRAFT_39023 [Sphaerobolus stellatus SS14]|uniref:Uncharacterized protein n=1 Tax=Sphaerobolus stellatus (strain SS14) TaxID=990650 RepID=A0A0C9UH64_SPHS4|nr:hypothetical protein M422DRAFT_39023 [Sphaerobolus stellatus SS14]
MSSILAMAVLFAFSAYVTSPHSPATHADLFVHTGTLEGYHGRYSCTIPTHFVHQHWQRVHSLSVVVDSAAIDRVTGTRHTNLISGLAGGQGSVWSIKYDDNAR